MSAIDGLLAAVRAEREELVQEAERLRAALSAKQDEIKQYDRILNAASPPAAKPKGKRDSNEWNVNPKKVEAIYDYMVAHTNGDVSEFTLTTLANETRMGYSTVSKAMTEMHEQGRVRLARMDGATKLWAVVS